MSHVMTTIRCMLLVLLPAVLACAPAHAATQSVDTILSQIEALEGENDPKCYATASRLEDFMFGTPLTAAARNSKNNHQKSLVSRIWHEASVSARTGGKKEVGAQHTSKAISQILVFHEGADGHWAVQFTNDRQIRINGVDKRQYSSIAYSLRAILAVQQEAMLQPASSLLPLTAESIALIKDTTDLYTLAVLKIADELAREESHHELDAADIESVWTELLPGAGAKRAAGNDDSTLVAAAAATLPHASLALTNAVIEQKVRSYAKYNEISNQLFVRNLQVYFAKRRWPESSEEARNFRNLYTESIISMARAIYLGAQDFALERGSAVIQEQDVAEFLGQYMPHEVNEYEDAIFFPRLPGPEQVVIESYDMDAFRDSGIHWRYLQFAIQSDGFNAQLEPDPFALELITESIAQLGVLLLRLTGDIGVGYDQKRIATSHLTEAVDLFHRKTNANHKVADDPVVLNQVLASSVNASQDPNGTLFTDVSSSLGIKYMHRSSDWLNRLLRSYLHKDETTGIITIPPAFGGSGVAVGDLNNDGQTDILLLGGLGNRLYINRAAGQFEDITRKAGLEWERPEDRNPGEPRQPLIADLDNDGHQDIVITYVDDSHLVYRNNGDETFTDVTAVAKLGGKDLVGGPATVFDFDNDGLLDIYITYFGNYIKGVLPTLERRNYNGLPNQLFRNKGGFVFENVTDGSGLANGGWAQAVTHTDINRDGFQDVIVGNDFGVNSYYRPTG